MPKLDELYCNGCGQFEEDCICTNQDPDFPRYEERFWQSPSFWFCIVVALIVGGMGFASYMSPPWSAGETAMRECQRNALVEADTPKFKRCEEVFEAYKRSFTK